ncbi:hypothetical protein CW748_10760 [Alteromonadales bacterium alter-6D02]|nr:hypothetical protein CW748_10760 [Alteromonadales bacterium alter-6D02]
MELIKAFIPLIICLSIWISVGVYYGKKIKKHKEKLVVDDSRPVNCLTLTRGLEATNYLRKYSIILNGENIGNIASGETKHFELATGKHNIAVKIDWCKSKQFEFDMIGNKNTELNCGANYNNWKCLFMHAIKPSNWLYIKFA